MKIVAAMIMYMYELPYVVRLVILDVTLCKQRNLSFDLWNIWLDLSHVTVPVYTIWSALAPIIFPVNSNEH
jgi:hypothetical protein